MSESTPLTVTDLIAGSSAVLEAAGYRAVSREASTEVPGSVRLFEDPYAIVGIGVFDTFTELRHTWPEVQGFMVDLMSRSLVQGDAKAWDGYLVLLTPGIPDRDSEVDAEAIRSDTVRLRKLVATGTELLEPSDVERVLLPLLPIGPELRVQDSGASVLDLLPDVLSRKGIPAEATAAVMKAFEEQRPLLEGLHEIISQ